MITTPLDEAAKLLLDHIPDDVNEFLSSFNRNEKHMVCAIYPILSVTVKSHTNKPLFLNHRGDTDHFEDVIYGRSTILKAALIKEIRIRKISNII